MALNVVSIYATHVTFATNARKYATNATDAPSCWKMNPVGSR